MSGRTRDPCLDVEEKALRRAPFARVGADLGCGEDIAQENPAGRPVRARPGRSERGRARAAK